MDRLMRACVILLLLGAAVTFIIAGTEALPAWLRGMAARAEIVPTVLAKILTGLSLAMAGIVAALGPRGRGPACARCCRFGGPSGAGRRARVHPRGP